MYIIARDYSFNCTNSRYKHGRKIKKNYGDHETLR